MPNLDNTGPEGIGPTGRGAGSCPNKANIFTSRFGIGRGQGQGCNRGFGGRGQGLGQGRGRGCASGMGSGRNFQLSEKDEKLLLKEEVKSMEEQLTLMKNRLGEIDK